MNKAIAWALGDDETCLVLELCQDISRDKVLAWLEDEVAQIRWGSGGKHRKPIRDGLIVAVFGHYESRAAQSRPLLHDHAVVLIRAWRPDGKGTWGNLSADSCWPTSSPPTPSTPCISWGGAYPARVGLGAP